MYIHLKMNNYLKYFGPFILVCLISCQQDIDHKEAELNSSEILEKSTKFHDPNGIWGNLELSIHIQEPRLNNPGRYSLIKLNNNDNSFELVRNRDHHLSRYIVDRDGNIKVYLDDKEDIASDLIEKYRLDKPRVLKYRDSYQMRYGLPMSLTDDAIKSIGKVESSTYNNQACYKIPIELNKEMFSTHWLIYIAKSNFEYKGMEIIFPDDYTKGERLYFEGIFSIDNIKVPRIRHWHKYSDDTYSGSDIIIKALEN